MYTSCIKFSYRCNRFPICRAVVRKANTVSEIYKIQWKVNTVSEIYTMETVAFLDIAQLSLPVMQILVVFCFYSFKCDFRLKNQTIKYQ